MVEATGPVEEDVEVTLGWEGRAWAPNEGGGRCMVRFTGSDVSSLL